MCICINRHTKLHNDLAAVTHLCKSSSAHHDTHTNLKLFKQRNKERTHLWVWVRSTVHQPVSGRWRRHTHVYNYTHVHTYKTHTLIHTLIHKHTRTHLWVWVWSTVHQPLSGRWRWWGRFGSPCLLAAHVQASKLW